MIEHRLYGSLNAFKNIPVGSEVEYCAINVPGLKKCQGELIPDVPEPVRSIWELSEADIGVWGRAMGFESPTEAQFDHPELKMAEEHM